MLDLHTRGAGDVGDASEPAFHPGEEVYPRAECLEILFGDADVIPRLFQDEQHIGEDVIHALALGKFPRLLPEIPGRAAQLLDQPELLHILRGERLVEVVTYRHHGGVPVACRVFIHDPPRRTLRRTHYTPKIHRLQARTLQARL